MVTPFLGLLATQTNLLIIVLWEFSTILNTRLSPLHARSFDWHYSAVQNFPLSIYHHKMTEGVVQLFPVYFYMKTKTLMRDEKIKEKSSRY